MNVIKHNHNQLFFTILMKRINNYHDNMYSLPCYHCYETGGTFCNQHNQQQHRYLLHMGKKRSVSQVSESNCE